MSAYRDLDSLSPVRESALTRTVPFDYVITVPVDNEPGRLRQSLVNVSTVGPFVITGIGYSLLVDERQVPSRFGPIGDGAPGGAEELPSTPIPSLSSPAVPPIVIRVASTRGGPRRKAASAPAAAAAAPDRFRLFGAPRARVQILVNGSVVPPAKGASFELDDRGRLQVDLGDRVTDRATVVVSDVSNGRSGPALVLQPVDGGAVSVSPQFGPLAPRFGATRFQVVGTPGATLEVSVRAPAGDAQPRLQLTVTMPSVDDPVQGLEAGIATVDLGTAQARGKDEPLTLIAADRVLVQDAATRLSAVFQVPASPLDISLRTLPAFALRRGFRLAPALLRQIENEVPPPLAPGNDLASAFEACGTAPQELNFLYAIIDNGTGRALQSEPIHNVAGLGIADGDRPFRTFPKPIVLQPRSVLLFQVQEISGGPGTLYFVLQGYKVVGASQPRFPGS